MGTRDLTVKILEDIREDIRGVRTELAESRAEFAESRAEFAESRAEANARFEAIETTLRDLAQQMVMLARGVKVAIDTREINNARIDNLERRVDALEHRTG